MLFAYKTNKKKQTQKEKMHDYEIKINQAAALFLLRPQNQNKGRREIREKECTTVEKKNPKKKKSIFSRRGCFFRRVLR